MKPKLRSRTRAILATFGLLAVVALVMRNSLLKEPQQPFAFLSGHRPQIVKQVPNLKGGVSEYRYFGFQSDWDNCFGEATGELFTKGYLVGDGPNPTYCLLGPGPTSGAVHWSVILHKDVELPEIDPGYLDGNVQRPNTPKVQRKGWVGVTLYREVQSPSFLDRIAAKARAILGL